MMRREPVMYEFVAYGGIPTYGGMANMHHQLTRVTARTALIGAVIALGSTAAAQGAMAGPTTSGIVTVPCNTKALTSALSGASNGEKLQLAFGCTYLLTKPLPAIDTSLTIVGLGATLDRSEAPRTPLFTILAVDGGDVTFVEVNFRNGVGRQDTCVLVGHDCADAADIYSAGAIANEGGNITVLGGTFTDNSSQGYGGAIANDDGTLTMTSTYFVDNRANRGGGAIYNDDTMTLRSSHFLDNRGKYGGAIYNEGTATIIGTTFIQGDSLDGGALYNEDQATLSSVTMQNNSAAFGGGIYNDETLTVASSNIVNNYADIGGGGIYNDDDESVTLSRTKVTGNVPDNCEPINTIAGCSG
jgi:predicted outer membrane repeat protein